MKSKVLLSKLLLILIICCNIGCDQLSKSIIRRELTSQDQLKFFNDSLTVLKVENFGAFLSYGDDFPEGIKFVFLSLLPLLILMYAVYHLLSKTSHVKLYATGFCFLIGGGIGNLYDRLLYGSVTDFLHLDLGVVETGVFNLADVSISIGSLMLFLAIYRRRKSSEMLASTPSTKC
ncbi:signal peptidase II [Pedobacter immunditicola]|uniref:signal peptidase II n=1 Tax=Pedobacter immunditicola TaxID=3133440 RepID=UPI0030A1EB38